MYKLSRYIFTDSTFCCIYIARLRMYYSNSHPVPFEMITENVYLDDTTCSRDKKRAKKMVCECQFDPG